MNKRVLPLLLLLLSSVFAGGQSVSIGLLKYDGGGDWYANPTSLPNLIDFCNKNLNTSLYKDPITVNASSKDLFKYPLLYMTGHGNVLFNPAAVNNLRLYLQAGGFLHIDDNYGMDQYVRREMKKVFPDLDFVELPFDHPIYHQKYDFKEGLPKIHAHDNKAPQGFGLFLNKRLVCFYTYECDLGDGWEDPSVHNNPQEVRLKALQMGANIVAYVFNRKAE